MARENKEFAITGINHLALVCSDMERTVDFYTKVLGMRVTWRMKIRETGGEIAVLKSPRGKQRLELNWYPPRGRYRRYRQGDELDHIAFAVPNVDAFLREHRPEFKVAMKPFNEGSDRLAYVTDPDGVWIELMSPLKRRRKKGA